MGIHLQSRRQGLNETNLIPAVYTCHHGDLARMAVFARTGRVHSVSQPSETQEALPLVRVQSGHRVFYTVHCMKGSQENQS